MNIAVRIVAEHAGDKDDPQDVRWKVVFVGVLDGSQLLHQEYFGYTAEVNEHDQVERWPFRLHPPQGKRSAMIDFGPGCDSQFEETNVYEREMKVGGLFSRGLGDDAGTYRVVAITPLC